MTEEDGSATGVAARELLIDRQLPRFEARTFSALPVDAGTERTYQAVRALDPDQVGQTVPFMQLMVRLPGPPSPARAASAPGHPRQLPKRSPASSTGRPSSSSTRSPERSSSSA